MKILQNYVSHGKLKFKEGREYLQEKNDGSFNYAIRPVLIMAQCFSLLPVGGVYTKDISNLKFKWISFRIFYAVVVLFFEIVDFILIVR